VKLVVSGAGCGARLRRAAARFGLKRENIWLTDSRESFRRTQGAHGSREGEVRAGNRARTLERSSAEPMCSWTFRGGVLTRTWCDNGVKPLILALANPTPEILRKRHGGASRR